MVARGGTVHAEPNAILQAPTPFLATAPVAESLLFPIPRWRFRAGRGPEYDAWWRQVTRLLHAFGVEPAGLRDECPVMPSKLEKSAIVTRASDEEGVEMRSFYSSIAGSA